MPYEFTDRVFLGTIPGLARGMHPMINPPAPGTNAGVRENRYPVDRAGEIEIWRFNRIRAVAEFAVAGQTCTAVCYHSRINPNATDLSPLVDGPDEWMARAAEVPINEVDWVDAGGGNIAHFIIAYVRWFTIRVIAGNLPTRWRVYGIPDREGGGLALG